MEKSPEAFRTISEVAQELDVPKHVLRFWEGKFSQLRPMKRGGGRRYYRPEDVELLRGIRQLLYDDGYTIKGVQKILRQHGVRYVMEYDAVAGDADAGGSLREIPDVASEAARGVLGTPAHERETAAPDQIDDDFVAGPASDEEDLPPFQRERLLVLLGQMEACRKVLDPDDK